MKKLIDSKKKKEEAEKEAREERERAKGVSWGMEVDLLL